MEEVGAHIHCGLGCSNGNLGQQEIGGKVTGKGKCAYTLQCAHVQCRLGCSNSY